MHPVEHPELNASSGPLQTRSRWELSRGRWTTKQNAGTKLRLRPSPGYSASAVKAAVPWLLLFAISAVAANLTNTAVARALSRVPAFAEGPTVARGFDDLCGQDVDFVLYERINRWLPAGRSAFCSSKMYMDGPAKGLAAELAHAGRLEARVSVTALGAVRLEFYCADGRQERIVGGDAVFRTEARVLYQQLCTPPDGSELRPALD
jgi:NAD(P)-dependent dehydrogenase (short-subunit alcohol dehydrogenase family)